MDSRRPDEPARQVVGFHIEGKSPSPKMNYRSPLSGWDGTRANSPMPVRIPPGIPSPPEPRQEPRQEPSASARPLNRSISSSNPHSGLTNSITAGQELLPAVNNAEPIPEPVALPEPSEDPPSTASAATKASSPKQAGRVKPAKGPPRDVPPKPKQTKAERRELQESQRAKKKEAAAKAPGGTSTGQADGVVGGKNAASAPDRSNASTKSPPKTRVDPGAKPTSAPKSSKRSMGVSVKPSEMFAHLPSYRHLDVTELASRDNSHIHPAVLSLGLKYAEGIVKGGNARCVAMLNAICQVIRDYTTPEGKSLSRDLQSSLNTQIAFLVSCRPLSVSMGNAIRFLKLHISKIDPATPEHQAKTQLIELISNFIQEKVIVADQALVEHVVTNIHDGDNILIYAYSYVVLEALLAAHQRGRKFQVVVVDSQPQLEGRRALKKLMAATIPCTYVFITNVSNVMRQATKVFLGASSVLSNGTVISQAGSACVAFMAHTNHKPVVVCCETYKFHERVQLDSIIHNELGNPDDLASTEYLKGWRELPKLELLNLKYDAMPKEYVTMVATEFGAIPPSSVPVILREYRQDS